MTRVVECRLIIDPPAAGAWNMGLDEALLVDAAGNGSTSLRFYGWNEPTLSLGYFQKYADRQSHVPSLACAVVRRQTGGGAILHDRELTYSLVLPASHPLAKQADRLHRVVHEDFIAALSSGDSNDLAGRQFEIREHCHEPSTSGEPFLCFQRQADGDVVLRMHDAGRGGQGSNPKSLPSAPQPASCIPNQWKIIGSAQRRHRGAVLQHGSILLERSPAAPELPGIGDLTGRIVAADELVSVVALRLAATLGVRLLETTLSTELKSRAGQLANNKYGSPAWTNRR